MLQTVKWWKALPYSDSNSLKDLMIEQVSLRPSPYSIIEGTIDGKQEIFNLNSIQKHLIIRSPRLVCILLRLPHFNQ